MTTPAPLILIVEDEAEIAELLEENLHALGFEACAVRDGADCSTPCRDANRA